MTFTPDFPVVGETTVHAKLSPNRSPRPQGYERPSLIVLHSTGGRAGTNADYLGSVEWLCNPDSDVSAHYVVSRTLEIAQLVPGADAAWHAGKSAWQGKEYRGSVNALSIGIEMEHLDGKEDWPDAQVEFVAQLCNLLMAHYGIPREQVVSHAAVALPSGRKIDPLNFPWTNFRKLLTPTPAPETFTPHVQIGAQRIPARLLNGTLYAPARDLAEALGYQGRWESQTLELLLRKE